MLSEGAGMAKRHHRLQFNGHRKFTGLGDYLKPGDVDLAIVQMRGAGVHVVRSVEIV
jgi:hypothetical protein